MNPIPATSVSECFEEHGNSTRGRSHCGFGCAGSTDRDTEDSEGHRFAATNAAPLERCEETQYRS